MEIRGVSAYDKLRTVSKQDETELQLSFTPHPDYATYLKIHKVLVGPVTAQKLERVHQNLAHEELSRYLSVAGWAAAEAALAQPDKSARCRNTLLEQTNDCWTRALENQLAWNDRGNREIAEHSAAYRYALDLAHLPLLQAMVSGNITEAIRKSVALDVLNICEANIVQMNLALKAHDQAAVSDHVGFGHEGNGILAFHSLNSSSLIVIPSSARADSGHHHPNQTHDLLAIQQKWGHIIDMTPIEIKSQVSQRDRARYKALLVRGKMHLSIEGKYSPEHTLQAFSAFFNGTQTKDEKKITDHARRTILDLFWLYKKGNKLADFAGKDSACTYREASSVHKAYPEVAPAR